MDLNDLPKDDEDIGDNLEEHVEESNNQQQDGDQFYKG